MTTQEIITKFGISRQTLTNWVRKKEIPAPKKKKGRQNVWTSEQIVMIEQKVNQGKAMQMTLFDQEEVTFQIHNRRYLGSKKKLLDFIDAVVKQNTNNIQIVADIFGGTGVVADLFKKQGKQVIVNDILTSNVISYQTWFGNEEINQKKLKTKIKELNQLEGFSGYVTENFGNRYFSLENAQKIDAIREQIECYTDLNNREKCSLLTSLLYAMDKVSNTVGHFDAYRKKMDSWAPILLKVPEITPNKQNMIYNEDANQLVKKIKADLVYIDTPYNSRGYENAYHVLENIMEWKKPGVEGVARKAVNRSEKSSDYTKAKAPQVFDELIQSISARYILVSYNNMAKKGNSRSNAKISNDEIMSSLKKRGKVTVFEMDYNAFTTGKSKIEGHKELLYLCEVEAEFIRSALNYTGSKHKLLPQLTSFFPNYSQRFIDLFAGGGSVTANRLVSDCAEAYLMNDIEKNVMGFFEHLSKVDIEDFIEKVEEKIAYYGLSNTKQHGYAFYGMSSQSGLGDYNKEKFLQLRSDYNENPSPLLFYLLVVFGFNNQIRYNAKGEYNLPVGKRDFNQNMESKLRLFARQMKHEKLEFLSQDFRTLVIKKDDFIYADPPYLLTTATYSENGAWSEKDERDLYHYLDKADELGAKFALSNVIVHQGKENHILRDWAAKYKLHVLDFHYNNSNYQSKAKHSETVEVLVTNY